MVPSRGNTGAKTRSRGGSEEWGLGGWVPGCWKNMGSFHVTFKNLRNKGATVSNLIKLTTAGKRFPNVLRSNAIFVSLWDLNLA